MDDEIQINIKMTSTAQVYKIKVLIDYQVQNLSELFKAYPLHLKNLSLYLNLLFQTFLPFGQILLLIEHSISI